MIRRTFLLAATLTLVQISIACTSAVVSGRATHDGRPILWKQRDTDNLENKLVFATGGRFAFVGVFNLIDTANAECYMGSNEAGFSIINTQSYNLVYPNYGGPMDEEGKVMRQALATCRTLEDFEQLLRDTRGKRGVETNYGVIDASGGAAYYETDPYGFVRYDVNDSTVAPLGYLIRTNFSASGTPEEGYGYIRHQTTANLFLQALPGEGITVDLLLLEATTNLRHSLVGTDLLQGTLPPNEEVRTMVPFMDFVPRYSTASAMIIHGVRRGEDPAATTIWTVLGFPLTTPVVPVWVHHADLIPRMLFASGASPAPLNARSLELKERCFPVKRPEGRNYLDLSKVANQQETGAVQRLRSAHRSILEATRVRHADGADGAPGADQIRSLYPEVERLVRSYYAACHLREGPDGAETRRSPR